MGSPMPDAAREAELRGLFDRAAGMTPAEAQVFVEGVADELLRERLRALLRQDASPTFGALQRPFVGEGGELRRVGRYELLRTLGSGGMGVVLLARQIEPVERLVAIKFVGDAGDGAAVLQRFRAEQQALARMDHPGIARVLDGGVTDEGAPYFVMEYVRGAPITEYCDRRRSSVAARVALLAQVCDAVQHAHQKGVIHRDLKPGNLLVVDDAGEVRPKVIDFGVARAIAGQLATMPPTRAGEIVGTLLYMSPEQAAPADQDLDTRTDIWSLGVVLFELLVGQTPLQLGADGASVLRFREDLAAGRVPTIGAAAAALSPAERSARAERRGADAGGWLRQLGGDLAWIVGKALETDRNRRYASASELAVDLRRHLAGEPVSARAPTVRYLAGRFVRRHRTAVLAGSLAALAIVGGGIAALLGMVAAHAARDDERAARLRLTAIVARQEALDEFREFAQLYGDRGLSGTAPSLRQALAAAAPMIEARWADRPAEQAAVCAGLGRALLQLGEPEPARLELRRAKLLAEGAAPVDPWWMLELLADLSRAERQTDELEASRRHLVPMLELAAAVSRDLAPEVAAVCSRLAAAAPPTDATATAFLADCDRLVALLAARPAGETGLRAVGELLFVMAVAFQQDGIAGSDVLLQRLEGVVRTAYGNDVELALVLGRLAENRLRMRQWKEALALADELLATTARLGLADHWLAAQAARVRGLALAGTGDGAAGEAELLALRLRLLPFRASANVRVRDAIAALDELARGLLERGGLEPFLADSLARWRHGADGPESPWWPASVDDGASAAVLEAALRAVEGAADLRPAVRDALLGALLLRLGRTAPAATRLEAASAAMSEPWPELLADVAVLRSRSGDAAGAEAVIARLRAGADGSGPAAVRWAAAVGRAAAARR